MDYKTKEYYRNEIKELSEKTKISEIYIAKKIVEISQKHLNDKNLKKSHIGYYLISDGKYELLNNLGIKTKKPIFNKTKVNRYILAIYLFTTIFSILLGTGIFVQSKNLIISVIFSLILYIPISEIVIQLINYILNKKVKPSVIPKLEFSMRCT